MRVSDDTGARMEWEALDNWLCSREADWLLDDAVLGCLPTYAVEEVLADFGIENSRDSRRRFSRSVNETLGEGYCRCQTTELAR